jgi:hypothetical protein
MNGPQPACCRDRCRGHAPAHDPRSQPAAFGHQHAMGDVSRGQPLSPCLDPGNSGEQAGERQRLVAVAGGITGLQMPRR